MLCTFFVALTNRISWKRRHPVRNHPADATGAGTRIIVPFLSAVKRATAAGTGNRGRAPGGTPPFMPLGIESATVRQVPDGTGTTAMMAVACPQQ